MIFKLIRYPCAIVLALTVASPLGAQILPQAPEPLCSAPFAELLSDKVFRAHSVHSDGHKFIPAPPDVKSGKAHLYRTMIKEGARLGPNFAGHYTIIPIGCGAATTCVAVADAKNGNVYFPPQLESVEALLVDTGNVNVSVLNYRRDSNLLIVIGSPNEIIDRAGVSYYEWDSGKFSLIRFVPAAKLCGLPKSTQF